MHGDPAFLRVSGKPGGALSAALVASDKPLTTVCSPFAAPRNLAGASGSRSRNAASVASIKLAIEVEVCFLDERREAGGPSSLPMPGKGDSTSASSSRLRFPMFDWEGSIHVENREASMDALRAVGTSKNL
eukprot:CAMPEP_0172765356 /NCGR_PEP_ID=MMETSP1074-20121228/179120_1 /TAXON_ID=2916 /ORGANISM="Ceratium fusus, Strain PA161109" /LENGTH=130 /DNA_ID=CAMNT_0013600293 /DNA_START=326 /DNA_END=718 /DNA_ORIENTATION=+